MISNPSKYQVAIGNSFENDTSNILINAVAGSGKTTTLLWLLSKVDSDKKALMCAFNKSIADELSVRCNSFSNVRVNTIHSLGLNILSQNGYKPVIEGNKYRNVVKKVFDKLPSKYKYEKNFSNYIYDVTNLLRNNFIFERQQAKSFIELYEPDSSFNCDIETILDITAEVLELGMMNTKVIDFIDMIFLPLVLELKPVYTYDVVMCDECQDLNTCQREIVLLYGNKTAKHIWVGDKNQAIYLFAGSDAKSFTKIENLPNTKLLPLSVNYRCPHKIIRYSQEIVPILEPFDNAIEGELDMFGSIDEIGDGDLVLSRMNMPLVTLYMKLLSKGVKCYIKGKDIGKSLLNLIVKSKEETIDGLFKKLHSDQDKLLDKIIVKKKLSFEDAREEKEYILFCDKIDCINAISDKCSTTSELTNKINKIFSEEGEGIVLSTVHKAKGLEFDNVHILCDFTMPAFFSKTQDELEQEYNIIYVARTRAKKKLALIRDFNPYSNKKERHNVFYIFSEDKKEILLKNGDYLLMTRVSKRGGNREAAINRFNQLFSIDTKSWKEFSENDNVIYLNNYTTIQDKSLIKDYRGFKFVNIDEIDNEKLKKRIETILSKCLNPTNNV